jgi:hypothetical protein
VGAQPVGQPPALGVVDKETQVDPPTASLTKSKSTPGSKLLGGLRADRRSHLDAGEAAPRQA